MAQWKQTIVTEREVIEIEQTARGGYARVNDCYSPFNGEYSFASTPDLALAFLKDKLETLRAEKAKGN